MLILIVEVEKDIGWENPWNAIDKHSNPRNAIDKRNFLKMPSYKRFSPRNAITVNLPFSPHR
jgi:hypothetical protein